MNTTLVHFNVKDNAGRAIMHLIEKSALARHRRGARDP
jgi:hypothetical protein